MSHVNKVSKPLKGWIIIIITFIMAVTAVAQVTKTITKSIDGKSGMFLVKEFGGILVEANGAIKVDMVLPADQRHADYKDLDIKEGDILKMVNGKKVSTTDMLEKIYNDFEVGEEVKLGLYRGKEMRIVKFAKADPEKLPGRMMVIGGPAGADKTSISMVSIGVVAMEKDSHVIVEEIIDNMLVEFEGQTPQKGDAILEIQGQSVTSADEIDKICETIPKGDKVSLLLSRKDKQYTTAYKKPELESCSGAKQIKIKK